MHRALLLLAGLLSLSTPAAALVGGASEVGNESARPIVMIVGDRGNFCTGTAIARDVVLTAAHCVLPGGDYKLIEFDARRQPVLKDVASIVRHPRFNLQSLLGHVATADVALLKLASPLAVAPAVLAGPRERVAVGDPFVVHGYGLTVRGDGKTGGTLRSVTLVATGKPGNLQIRLIDPATGGTRQGRGACTGDSGGPVFADDNGQLAVIGVVSWSTGPNAGDGCGGLTGVTPLELYRGWIAETSRKIGGR